MYVRVSKKKVSVVVKNKNIFEKNQILYKNLLTDNYL